MNARAWLGSGPLPVPSEGQRDPEPGDLWTISWDRELLGVVLVGKVLENHSVVYPVLPALEVHDSSLLRVRVDDSVNVDCWLGAGFGMGNFMFESIAFSPVEQALVSSAVRRYHEGVDRISQATDDLRQMAETAVAMAQRAGCIEWPRPIVGEAVLDHDALVEHGVTPRHLAQMLSIAPGDAVKLWSGKLLVAAEQVAVVADRLQLHEHDLLCPYLGYEELELSRPRVKWTIRVAGQQFGEAEGASRARALRAALRPGRVASGQGERERARTRVDNALVEMLRTNRDD